MLELFVERVLTSAFPPNPPNAGLSPAESLRRFLEAIASGALLPGATGIHLVDPCEKDPVDALAPLTLQQREDITSSAQVFNVLYLPVLSTKGVSPLFQIINFGEFKYRKIKCIINNASN